MDYYIVFCGFGNPYNILRQISNLTRQHATGTSVATEYNLSVSYMINFKINAPVIFLD